MTAEFYLILGFILCASFVGVTFLGKKYVDKCYKTFEKDKQEFSKSLEYLYLQQAGYKTEIDIKLLEFEKKIDNFIYQSPNPKNLVDPIDKTIEDTKKDLWNDPKKIKESLKNLQENLSVPDDERFQSLTPNDAFHELSERLEVLEKDK